MSFILVFGGFRLVFLFLNRDLTSGSEELIPFALWDRGVLFDIVTTSYLIAIPFLLLSVANMIGKGESKMLAFSRYYLFFLSIPVIIISLSDFAWYKFFGARVNKAILSWSDDTGSILDVLSDNIMYIVLIVSGLFLIVLSYFGIGRISNYPSSKPNQPKNNLWLRVVYFLLAGLALFFGIRGDVESHAKPLQTIDAFRTASPFVNQLGLNPVFNFLHSLPKFDQRYMDKEQAFALVRQELHTDGDEKYPLLRNVSGLSEAKDYNIVLVLMESMSAKKVGYYGREESLTPHLDSLIQGSMFFSNCYSSGIHTYNGIYSSLYAMPAYMDRKPTTDPMSSGLKHEGLPVELKKRNYNNHYFCTGSPRFDNIWGFLPLNGFDEIHHGLNIPDSIWSNGWGMGDHSLFANGIRVMDSLSAEPNPFFCTFMTISTHSPWDIPEGISFQPNAEQQIDKSYQYADWSIGEFMKGAAQKPWFKNTIFVFVADHGQKFEQVYEMPLAYHHNPLLFYAPALISPEIDENYALQMDIFPTLMGLLGGDYRNNTMGVDLCHQTRPYAYFTADDKLGVLSDSLFLVMNVDGRTNLFKYRNKDLNNHLSDLPAEAKSMADYGKSMMQTTADVLSARLIGEE